MDNYVSGKAWKQDKYDSILEESFKLFAKKGIEPVIMTEIASVCGVGRATLFRYFPSKTDLVIAIAIQKWTEFIEWYGSLLSPEETEKLTGAQYLKYYLDSFLELYRNHKDMLCFNYDFNSFVRNAEWSQEQKVQYEKVASSFGKIFHELYTRGMQDGTLNSAISEQTMYSSTFHIMLAAVTRYAVGLAVVFENEPERELVMLEEMMLSKFTDIND